MIGKFERHNQVHSSSEHIGIKRQMSLLIIQWALIVKDNEVRTRSIKFVLAEVTNTIHQIMGQKQATRALTNHCACSQSQKTKS